MLLQLYVSPALVQCANVIHVDTVTVIYAPCERASAQNGCCNVCISHVNVNLFVEKNR